MLKRLTRSLRLYVIYSKRNYASFTVRDALNDTNSDLGTLQAKFAKHIALLRYQDDRQLPAPKIRYADYFPINDERIFRIQLDIMPADQVPRLIVFSAAYRSNTKDTTHAFLLNELDRVALNSLKDMNSALILETLYSFLFLIPSYITRLDFYRQALKRIVEDCSSIKLTKEAFTQICFFLGADKKNEFIVNLMNQFVSKHLTSFLPKLDHIDLAIVSNAVYKAAIVIKNEAFNQQLIDGILEVPLDQFNSGLLATYLKSLRLQRVQTERVCLHLSERFLDSHLLKQLDMCSLMHMFMFLVENRYDRQDTATAFMTHMLERIRCCNPVDMKFRAKDLANLIWCCASFNYKLSNEELRLLETTVHRKLDANEYRYDSGKMVDTCLSLWSLGHRNRDLFRASVDLRNEEIHRYGRKHQHDNNNFTKLLSAVAIEQPIWYRSAVIGQKYKPVDLSAKPPNHSLEGREDLIQLSKQLKSTIDVPVEIVCPIKGFNVPSILVRKEGDSTLIELLRPEDQLLFSKQPNMTLRLKMRLLEFLGYRTITITRGDTKSNTEYLVKMLKTLNMMELKSESEQRTRNILNNAC